MHVIDDVPALRENPLPDTLKEISDTTDAPSVSVLVVDPVMESEPPMDTA